MKTKIILGILALCMLIFNSCVSTKQIGQLNMVSTRNIETTVKYKMIQTYVTLTKEEKKKTRSETIQEAVDVVVKKVDGGEYLMNAKVYLVQHTYPFSFSPPQVFYAIEGDVWGIKQK